MTAHKTTERTEATHRLNRMADRVKRGEEVHHVWTSHDRLVWLTDRAMQSEGYRITPLSVRRKAAIAARKRRMH